ncbi:hypothetical protein J1605_003674 [Eschrichtius robustus]|uniref:Uncharacterized protein n=1 Tax=Eschrichtius robustus TaxID=9764 RepID=A0AB34HR77_ESCRO|nr:hypothetical protein J1605_003674 [Eschrichtius robustus]
MSEAEDVHWKIRDDDCSILTVDSSSDEELDYFVSGLNVQKGNISYMVIDSDSDDGCLCKQKRAKIAEVHIKGKYTTNLEKVQPHHAQSSQDESQQMFYSESFRTLSGLPEQDRGPGAE